LHSQKQVLIEANQDRCRDSQASASPEPTVQVDQNHGESAKEIARHNASKWITIGGAAES
jgi:hypothetical protein